MAFGIDDAIAAGLKILDKFIADPAEKAKAESELRQMANEARLAELNADNVEAQEVTKRQTSDMASDSWLSKNIRPMTLIAILAGYFFFAFASIFDYDTKAAYVELLGQWGMLIMSFYFGGRTLEKIIDMKQKGQNIIAWKAAVYSLVTFLAFLFMGNMILNLFQVDISSFAIAGALVIFVMAIEMLLGVEIFRNDGPEGAASIVPIVFPLIAGAGSFTTLLSLRALYGLGSILAALFLNILVIYVVIRNVHILERALGKTGVYVLRKFFGIILLALSVRMFLQNLSIALESF